MGPTPFLPLFFVALSNNACNDGISPPLFCHTVPLPHGYRLPNFETFHKCHKPPAWPLTQLLTSPGRLISIFLVRAGARAWDTGLIHHPHQPHRTMCIVRAMTGSCSSASSSAPSSLHLSQRGHLRHCSSRPFKHGTCVKHWLIYVITVKTKRKPTNRPPQQTNLPKWKALRMCLAFVGWHCRRRRCLCLRYVF